MLASNDVEEMIAAVIEERIPVVTTGGGNPGRYIQD
jgi:enoyl-[acyl-carrier protein] reductase II